MGHQIFSLDSSHPVGSPECPACQPQIIYVYMLLVLFSWGTVRNTSPMLGSPMASLRRPSPPAQVGAKVRMEGRVQGRSGQGLKPGESPPDRGLPWSLLMRPCVESTAPGRGLSEASFLGSVCEFLLGRETHPRGSCLPELPRGHVSCEGRTWTVPTAQEPAGLLPFHVWTSPSLSSCLYCLPFKGATSSPLPGGLPGESTFSSSQQQVLARHLLRLALPSRQRHTALSESVKKTQSDVSKMELSPGNAGPCGITKGDEDSAK